MYFTFLFSSLNSARKVDPKRAYLIFDQKVHFFNQQQKCIFKFFVVEL